MESIFKLYSIGYVAENKPQMDRFLNVYPAEVIGGTDGAIGFNPTEVTYKGTDKEGKAYDVKVTVDVTINCEWLPAGTNRLSPPDVVIGELVEIWRLGDSDQFYWKTMGLRDNLRSFETAIFAFSATPSLEGKPLSLDRCYFFEVSGHNGTITLQTSQANGEPYLYTGQINAKEGFFVFQDDIGDKFEFDSNEKYLKLINADGSFVEIDKKKIHGHADEEIKLTVGGTSYTLTPSSITAKTGTISNKADDSITDDAGSNISHITGSTSMEQTASSLDIDVSGAAYSQTPTSVDITVGASIFSQTPANISLTSGGASVGVGAGALIMAAAAITMGPPGGGGGGGASMSAAGGAMIFKCTTFSIDSI